MTRVGSIESVWRYPAKSMMGDRFPSVPVDEGGVTGDRGWAVRDEQRGGIRGAKKIGGLMRLHARYVEEPQRGSPPPPIEVTAPDGQRVRSDDDDVHERLSALLDHRVTLWPLRPKEDLDHYRRGAPDTDDVGAEMRAMFGRAPDEPLPTFEGIPLDVLVEYESPPGTYFDAFPIHVVTDRSLETLARLAPGSDFDVRRFRPNVVVAAGDDVDGDFPEQGWLGRKLDVGDAELEVTAACPRCVMVTRDFAELPEDRQVLRTVVRHADQNIGVYANVVRPGTLQTGAAVTLV
ncbi:MAG TPA: MOSC domain-containing protein [Acidimicrobiia bacterium]|nr:MOSC domain-containing protein [Acidimicrobiia bacterium]